LPPDHPFLFLTESGLLGSLASGASPPVWSGLVDSNGMGVPLQPGASLHGTVDLAAMLRGGHVDVAIVQAAQVSRRGDFTHWTTAATSGLFAPGLAVDLAAGARRVVVMMAHSGEDGSPNVVPDCASPIDGVGCVDVIITDLAVIKVTSSGLELLEVAPGWRSGDVSALTEAQLLVSPELGEMTSDPTTFNAPVSKAAGKVFASGLDALSDLPDGAVVMIDGFAGPGGTPHYLLTSLRDHGARDLTIISNTAGIARVVNFGTPPGKQAIDHTILIDNQQVKKAIASYPVSPSASRPTAFELAYRRGEVELELVPQGTLAERLRAGGAGVAAFYTPTGVGTLIAQGKETRVIAGKEYVLEEALRADFCIIRGYRADRWGNVVYKGTSRNFNSVMAPAANITVVEVDQVVDPGGLDPEKIVTPGIYVDRIVVRPSDFSPYE
jgi:3-oxoacid CoA-transferase A subunit/3-oxoacid CoA-transferase B subunit